MTGVDELVDRSENQLMVDGVSVGSIFVFGAADYDPMLCDRQTKSAMTDQYLVSAVACSG